MVRPRRVPEAASALGGGLLMIAIGAVGPAEAAGLLLGSWNVFLFLLGLMLVSTLADLAGVFDWLAVGVARLAGGSARRLLCGVFGLGVALTAILSNDATALILTPVVYALVTRLGLPARPYVYTCTFIADTASFLLPVSNPINILMLEAFPLGLAGFLRHLLPAALVAIGLNLAAFLWLFRADLRAGYEPGRVGLPAETVKRVGLFRYAAGCLVVLGLAYLAAAARQWPLSLVALGGALALLAGATRCGCLDLGRLGREVSWPIFGFVAGLFVLVRGAENVGLAEALGRLIVALAGADQLRAALVGVVGAALGANLVNNVPAALVLIAALGRAPDPAVRDTLVYGTLVGADLGPNLTTVGSLATMLWLLLLRRRGLEVSSLEYFKIGALVTPPMLLLSALAVWLAGGP
jgi:arsenical pump membrane protein